MCDVDSWISVVANVAAGNRLWGRSGQIAGQAFKAAGTRSSIPPQEPSQYGGPHDEDEAKAPGISFFIRSQGYLRSHNSIS